MQIVIDKDHSVYENILVNANNVTDPTWESVVPIFRNLTVEEKVFFAFRALDTGKFCFAYSRNSRWYVASSGKARQFCSYRGR